MALIFDNFNLDQLIDIVEDVAESEVDKFIKGLGKDVSDFSLAEIKQLWLDDKSKVIEVDQVFAIAKDAFYNMLYAKLAIEGKYQQELIEEELEYGSENS